MTAPANDLVGGTVNYPVYLFESNWSDDAGSHEVAFQVMLSPGGTTPSVSNVDAVQAFLEAMAAWALDTYQPGQPGGSSGSSILASITQAETTLYTSD